MRASWIALLSLLAGAGGACGDDGGTPAADAPPGNPTWQKLGEHRPSSLLAVWAESPSNVWVVGGREGFSAGPPIFHYDGTSWSRLDAGSTSLDLWSVFGVGDTVFFGGSNGTLLRYQNGTIDRLTTPGGNIIFGLWASSPTDLWAVGGQTAGQAFVWHYDGTTVTARTDVPADLVSMGTVWKVTGRAPNDVYMSASRGMVLHWDGTALTSQQVGATTEESLFSIGCRSDGCVVAGTNGTNGVLYETSTGASWTSGVPTPDGPVWRGMTPVGDHQYVVGQAAAVLRRDGTTWKSDPSRLTTANLHAAWSDADGNLFAVGGDFDRAPTTDGVLLFKGATTLPALP